MREGTFFYLDLQFSGGLEDSYYYFCSTNDKK